MKRTIGLLTAVALSGAAYAQDVKVGGYVDGGFAWTKDGAKSAATEHADSQFVSNDFSLTLSGNSGGSFGFVELGRAGAFKIAPTQYYGGHKYDNGFSWRVGAFNGLLGSEDKESVNRDFIKQGFVSNSFYGYYGGLQLSYAAGDNMNLDLVVGNQEVSNSDFGGALLPDGNGLNNPMWAAKLSTKMDDVSAYVGTEGQKNNTSNSTDYKIDIGAKAKIAELHAGAEVAIEKSNGGDSAFGFGIHAGYDLMENIDLVARFDWANKSFGIPAQEGSATAQTKAGYEITAGPNFKLSDALKVRAQWSMTKDGTVADAGQNIYVMGVYKF